VCGDLWRLLVERREDAFRRGQRAGGINGRKMRVIVEDQGYQVPKAVQACNKLINRDNVLAFVGRSARR